MAGRRRKRDVGMTRAGVTHHIRQRLLGHAVDTQLLLGRERRQPALDAAGDRHVCGRAEAVAERHEGTRETEAVERLWPQLERDPPDILEARTGKLLNLLETRLESRRGLLGEMTEAEQHGRQRLADLLM